MAVQHEYVWFDYDNFAVGAGIFTVSLGGQACLPGIYDEMEDKSQFEPMLNVCFVIMFVCYAMMGSTGAILNAD